MSTPTRKFKLVRRDSLYFGQFRHQCRFVLTEASALRKLDHGSIDLQLSYRSSYRWQQQKITPDTVNNLHKACDQLLALKNTFKMTVSGSLIYFYTSAVEDIEFLTQNTNMKLVGDITDTVITHEKGTVGLLEPKYRYRTYFKSHRPSNEQLEYLNNFIKNCGDEINASPGLQRFLKNKKSYATWLLDHYYIDHNDMKMATAMALVNPKLVGKTKPIVKVNN